MGSQWTIRGIAVLAAIISPAYSAWAVMLPGARDEYVSLQDSLAQVREIEVEDPRAEDAARKASQDKLPGINRQLRKPITLLDMEEIAWPHFDEWLTFGDLPPIWGPDPRTGQYVGSNPSGGVEPGGGQAWRVCQPNAGGYYIECGTCETWPINQPSSDIIEVTTFSGQGALMSVSNSAIELCAYAGAEDGQQIVVGYTQVPIVGGVAYPATYCEKTYYIQCEDCECTGAVPPIMVNDADGTTIRQDGAGDNTTEMWVGSSMACGPFTWTVTGTGAHFNSTTGPTSAETAEELETINVVADSSACGVFTITVTDSCGVSETGYIRVEDDSSWCLTASETCALGECTCPYPGEADSTVNYAGQKWYSDRIVGFYMSRQYTWWACTSAIYPCDHSWWDSHCLPADPGQEEPCITDDAVFVVPCVNSGSGAVRYYRYYMYHYEWKCDVDCP